MWAIYLLGLLIFIVLLGSGYGNMTPMYGGGSLQLKGGGLDYSAYFAPWWRQYYGATPLYGTSATAVDQFLIDPGTYYNWNSYWRRPLQYNYWREPYYHERKVYRPYLQDSIPGRRLRMQFYDFKNDTDVNNGVQAINSESDSPNESLENQKADKETQYLEKKGSYKYGVFDDVN